MTNTEKKEQKKKKGEEREEFVFVNPQDESEVGAHYVLISTLGLMELVGDGADRRSTKETFFEVTLDDCNIKIGGEENLNTLYEDFSVKVRSPRMLIYREHPKSDGVSITYSFSFTCLMLI